MRRLVVEPGRLTRPQPDGPPAHLALTPEEARYLRKVLRLKAREPLEVRDAAGHRCIAHLVDATTLALGAVEKLPARPTPRVLLFFAPPKGRRLDVLLEKATELGAAALQPVHTHRSVRRDAAPERMQRIVREAARQCGAGWAPELRPALELEVALSEAPDALRLVADPAAKAHLNSHAAADLPEVAVLSGPEGGLTREEVAMADAAGWRRFGLGDRILRAETAPLVALTIIGHTW